jgi:hypothetical protein
MLMTADWLLEDRLGWSGKIIFNTLIATQLFLGLAETEFSSYVGHYFACCTSPE